MNGILGKILSNVPSTLALIFILVMVIFSVLGYLILPDSTPDANESCVQIQKKSPGFTTWILRVPVSINDVETSWFEKLLKGEKRHTEPLAVLSWKLDHLQVNYVPQGRIQMPKSIPVLLLTRPVFQGVSSKFHIGYGKNYKVTDDKFIYIDQNEHLQIESVKKVLDDFKKNHVEKKIFWLGTDKAGRDILSRLILGMRVSLGIGLVAVVISLIIGVFIGSIGGFLGGWADKLVLWLMTVVWAVPSIMLVIAISLALQSKEIWVTFVAVGLTTWVEVARVVRGEIMSIREKLYIEAARALGINNIGIVFRHILPNLVGPVIVIATSNFASAILMESGLSFLGMGVQPPAPSWGVMISEGFQQLTAPNSGHLIIFPSLAVCITVLSFNIVGNALRDAVDPRSQLFVK